MTVHVDRVGKGVYAEVITPNFKYKLVSTVTELGWACGVYNMKTREWAERQWCNDMSEGKELAVAQARRMLGHLPAIEWEEESNSSF